MKHDVFLVEKSEILGEEFRVVRIGPDAGADLKRRNDVEAQRNSALARYHHYEFASAAYQIAIVLASAAVITGMMALVYAALGLGVIGLAFMALGFFHPHYLHSLHLI